ncbi:hypothetical protein [Desulfocurvibacter africanus]|uniref:Uncharacterized protein n=1 Tax=Desulfocurvibacter africanus subsp. africanus str. Walvis Bay TaxID=690850 RepID=F3YYD1_DESAF|nr:hypothetical protein [Desulfocurvibacter africanus]EGJ49575.1 hypothetical protein Desaf_1236 [Desulfocurvibacter africanus subsp. africanus str. Walvis Bay]
MRPRPKGLSIRYYISALLIIVSAAGLALAWDIYQESAEIDLQAPSKAPEPKAEVDIGQMEALFQEPPSDPSRYQVIAEQNLFSENRRAAADQAAQRAGQKDAPERKEEVQLLGTSILGERKSAMLRFLLFSDKKKAHIVEQGQTVRDEGERGGEGESGPSYTLVDVEQRRVTLKDQTGQTFSVSMSEPQQAQAQGPGQVEGQAEGQPEGWQRMQEMFQGRRGTPDPEARVDPPAQEPEKPSKPETPQAGKAPPATITSADNTTSGTWNVIR